MWQDLKIKVPHQNKELVLILQTLELGYSIAEEDTLLEAARIETSAFMDLMHDRVDLIPGTKGSGKSALFRMFVEFLPKYLLEHRKVVVAHGVQAPGDPVFHAYTDRFSKLSEEEFIEFWCIYLVSLAHEHFIKGPRYGKLLRDAPAEIGKFRQACADAKIPEIQAQKSLRDILDWSLHVLTSWRPKLKFTPPNDVGDFEFDLFGQALDTKTPDSPSEHSLPKYVNDIKQALEAILRKSNLSLWLMVDRLDEIFPRRSSVERTALRALLRSTRFFASSNIRVKVFLRDDMLEEVVSTGEGFTALTHVSARQADTLRWTTDQILTMIVKRLVANDALVKYLGWNPQQIDASAAYRKECFDLVFPPTVFRGQKQSKTIDWICDRCADGRHVVTPRDALDLLLRAKQKQQDMCGADLSGTSEWIIGAAALQYGFEELSKRKRDTYLRAEFPHLWKEIEKFSGGKCDYDSHALLALLGKKWSEIVDHLVAVGFLEKVRKKGETLFSIPFLYRHGMQLTQGRPKRAARNS